MPNPYTLSNFTTLAMLGGGLAATAAGMKHAHDNGDGAGETLGRGVEAGLFTGAGIGVGLWGMGKVPGVYRMGKKVANAWKPFNSGARTVDDFEKSTAAWHTATDAGMLGPHIPPAPFAPATNTVETMKRAEKFHNAQESFKHFGMSERMPKRPMVGGESLIGPLKKGVKVRPIVGEEKLIGPLKQVWKNNPIGSLTKGVLLPLAAAGIAYKIGSSMSTPDYQSAAEAQSDGMGGYTYAAPGTTPRGPGARSRSMNATGDIALGAHRGRHG